MRQYYVYILASRPGGALYVGVTNDLVRRAPGNRDQSGDEQADRFGISARLSEMAGTSPAMTNR
jgi:putative endonuclease